MACETCGDKPKKDKRFPSAVIEINNPESLVLLRKVVISASLGDDTTVPPVIGKYRNVILQYEANGHLYLYSSDGIPTFIEPNVPQEVLDRIANLETGLADEESTREREDTRLQQEMDDKQDELTPGENISIVDESGALVISAQDTTYTAFTGTDGQTAGASGLVPAPAATDAGKFLKADGTWGTAGGGSGPTVVQTTGTSTTDVMSQNAVTTELSSKANSSSLSTVATSGSYNDLLDKPAIPTVNDSTITITNNGSTVDSFTTNASSAKTIALSAPVITMSSTDPGEGSALAANNFVAVYGTGGQVLTSDIANGAVTAEKTDFILMTSGTTNSITLPAGYTSYHLEAIATSPSQSSNGAFYVVSDNTNITSLIWTRRTQISTGDTTSVYEGTQTGSPRVIDGLGSGNVIGTNSVTCLYSTDIVRNNDSTNPSLWFHSCAHFMGVYCTSWTSANVTMAEADAPLTIYLARENGSVPNVTWRLRAYK